MSLPVHAAVAQPVAATVNLRTLGRTGIEISELSFGTGPVSGLMTLANAGALQRATIERALAAGINWFDTAATYGAGQSETSLGAVLADLRCGDEIHVATKVRVTAEQLGDIKSAVKASVAASLKRLGRERVTLVQLHNSVTVQRGDSPTSITVGDVLGTGGVLEAFEELRAEGVVAHLGLTGLGDFTSMREVVGAGSWAAMQVNEHALIRRAAGSDNLLDLCASQGVGVLAIRVMAGGALAGHMPSAHTLKTPFFPVALYERDLANARRAMGKLPHDMTLPELAIRHVLGDPRVASAIIGFAEPMQVDEAVEFARRGDLPESLRASLQAMALPEERP
jgi:L-galactose dehydrogenase/L-glyceraldehyde 3-phosphate reductase